MVCIVRIDSKTPKDERKLYVQRFRKGLIDIIVNVDIFSEGFDCPDIEFIQLARPTKSLTKYLQQVGRGLRPIPGKEHCMILDNVGLHFLFGLPNAERNWIESFEGGAIVKTQKKSRACKNVESVLERNFTEGNDEMFLIEDIKVKKQLWSDKDDELLITLYKERKCSLEVLSAVFNKKESDIRKRILDLQLDE